MHAVGAMMQGAEQREQILHMLAAIQPLDFNRLETQTGRAAANLGDERIEMAAGADEYGNTLSRIFAPRLENEIEHTARFILSAGRFVALD